jgi:CheY-like chemotaxis protein
MLAIEDRAFCPIFPETRPSLFLCSDGRRLIRLFRAGDLRQPMSASKSAFNSAVWFREPASDAVELKAPRLTPDVVVFYIAIPREDGLGVLRRLQERRGTARVSILAVCDEEPKALPTQTEGKISPRRIYRQTENPQWSWSNTIVWTLLAGCCTVTLFFAFQAPFRLRANENQTSTVEFRAETAALPARLGSQTMSRFRPGASHRSGYDKELASSSVDDSRHKRRLSRELVQHRQPQVCIQSGQFSGHR